MFPKLCKECVHYLPGDPALYSFSTCGRSAVVQDAFTGQDRHRFCATERENPSSTACGPTAQYWQLHVPPDADQAGEISCCGSDDCEIIP